MPGVLADYGVLFAGATYAVVDDDDSTVTIDEATPALGATVTVTITALNGVTPAPNRGVRVTVDPATDLTIPDAVRTSVLGVCTVVIQVGAEAAETLRTISVSCGGVALLDEPTFTPTAP
jgi:hypothetical protein